MGSAELGNRVELGHMGLELGLNLSFKDFPGGGGWSRSGNTAQLSWGLSLAIKSFYPPLIYEDRQGSLKVMRKDQNRGGGGVGEYYL